MKNTMPEFIVFAALLAIGLGAFLGLSTNEWVALVLVIGFVISMEMINSAIEGIADFISPERHVSIEKIKDLAAGGVLVSTVAAAVVGLIVFLPKLLGIFGSF